MNQIINQQKLISAFQNSIDLWLDQLEKYTYSELIQNPGAESWSLGQVYMHLIEETDFYLQQITACICYSRFSNKKRTTAASALFENNEFPEDRIAGDPRHINIPQPESKNKLQDALLQLKSNIIMVASQITMEARQGKMKHPGFGYFTAAEWLQYAEIHLRHHLKQKHRIDEFLNKIKIDKS